jgi:hypothetical protein
VWTRIKFFISFTLILISNVQIFDDHYALIEQNSSLDLTSRPRSSISNQSIKFIRICKFAAVFYIYAFDKFVKLISHQTQRPTKTKCFPGFFFHHIGMQIDNFLTKKPVNPAKNEEEKEINHCSNRSRTSQLENPFFAPPPSTTTTSSTKPINYRFCIFCDACLLKTGKKFIF